MDAAEAWLKKRAEALKAVQPIEPAKPAKVAEPQAKPAPANENKVRKKGPKPRAVAKQALRHISKRSEMTNKTLYQSVRVWCELNGKTVPSYNTVMRAANRLDT
jgi:hypothetical protein